MDPKKLHVVNAKRMHTFILKALKSRPCINKPSGDYDGNKVVSWSECAWRPKT